MEALPTAIGNTIGELISAKIAPQIQDWINDELADAVVSNVSLRPAPDDGEIESIGAVSNPDDPILMLADGTGAEVSAGGAHKVALYNYNSAAADSNGRMHLTSIGAKVIPFTSGADGHNDIYQTGTAPDVSIKLAPGVSLGTETGADGDSNLHFFFTKGGGTDNDRRRPHYACAWADYSSKYRWRW